MTTTTEGEAPGCALGAPCGCPYFEKYAVLKVLAHVPADRQDEFLEQLDKIHALRPRNREELIAAIRATGGFPFPVTDPQDS